MRAHLLLGGGKSVLTHNGARGRNPTSIWHRKGIRLGSHFIPGLVLHMGGLSLIVGYLTIFGNLLLGAAGGTRC
jgi:hypothetical protein